MMDSISSYIKPLALYLESLDPEKAMKLATATGISLAKELNFNQQKILGNCYIVIGNILTKNSCFLDDPQKEQEKNKWQQSREIEIEKKEIEMELEKIQKRIDALTKRQASQSMK
jgi:hypothetical protein